jgi:hypothetical protein
VSTAEAARGEGEASPGFALPELASVPWREPVSGRQLSRWGRLWTTWTVALALPFTLAALLLLYIQPLAAPVALASFAHAWIIPELYAFRGANVVRPRGDPGEAGERLAQGLLGDLLDHAARELQRSTGLAMERGELGVWLVGEAGALLVAPGARRVHGFCVTPTGPALPPSDRIAHLLLALRSDEVGFATVANHAFSGAPWRIRRRMRRAARPALAAARQAAHALHDSD